jgi:hypothetical protein
VSSACPRAPRLCRAARARAAASPDERSPTPALRAPRCCRRMRPQGRDALGLPHPRPRPGGWLPQGPHRRGEPARLVCKRACMRARVRVAHAALVPRAPRGRAPAARRRGSHGRRH